MREPRWSPLSSPPRFGPSAAGPHCGFPIPACAARVQTDAAVWSPASNSVAHTHSPSPLTRDRLPDIGFCLGKWQDLLYKRPWLVQYVSEDPALGEVLDLLSDEYARDILAAASERPMSANELAEQCGMSEPTVYRRISSLQEHELVAERTKVETGGNDYKLYVATLSRFALELEDGSFESAITRRQAPDFPGQAEDDTADRFTKMWENL